MAPEPIAEVAHKPGLISVRSVVFVIAATTAALFILDSYFSEPAPPQKITFRTMSTGDIHASSGFQNLIATVCWLIGIGFTIRGCVRLRQAMKFSYGTPEFDRLCKRAGIYIFLGFCCMTFPFLQQAMQPHGLYRYGYPVEPTTAEVRDNLMLLVAVCWYIGGLAFYFGSLALTKAQQLKNDPAGAALKDKAAACLLIGFLLTAAPLAYAGFREVDLW